MNHRFMIGAIAFFGLVSQVACQTMQSESNSSGGQASDSQAASSQCTSTEAVATMDGKPITLADILKNPNVGGKSKNDMFEAVRDATDDYVTSQLVAIEAAKKKKTSEETMKEGLEAAAKNLPSKEVQKFYDQLAKARGGQMPPLAQIEPQIRQHLGRGAYIDELKRSHKVAYLVNRPRVQVAVGDNPVKGTARAPVTIVAFSDYQCPYCKRSEATVADVLKEYRGKVKLYFRDYPLPGHTNAKPAAIASRCAGAQGKFWEYHDKLFEIQAQLNDEAYSKIAGDLRLNTNKFKECYSQKKFEASVDKDLQEGAKLGVQGTPAYFINGVFLNGAQPFEKFKEIIDEEIKVAKASGSKNSVMP